MFRKHILFLATLLVALTVDAQRPNGFNPEQFERELEQFIVTEAGLSPAEASQFFPLYREMRKKQLTIFNQDRMDRFVNMTDEKECAKAIKQKDENEIEQKEIQRDYHNKFMRVLSAQKVLRIIKAEDKFHRQFFKRTAKREHARK
ncbi:MAG: hypothetical protein ACI350_01085 [Prevotella sp.]